MILLLPLTIILVSLLTLFPVFHVGLYGDDWLAIFRYVVHVAPPSKEGWNLFTYYLTPYGSQDIIMGLLHQQFGNNAFYYEVTSYIFRLLAAFSLYPLLNYLTKSKLATFFAILFFSITTTGFDSTGWLLTLPTYLTIAFFNLFLYFYIKFQETKKIKLLLYSGLFFYFGYITAYQRIIGAPLFILSLEIFWLVRNRTISNLKQSTLRILFIISILFVISISGHTLGNRAEWIDRLTGGFNIIQKLVNEGRSEFFLYPLVTIGGMIIPNFAFPSIQINTKLDMLSYVVFPINVLFLLLLLVIKSNTNKLNQNDIYKTIFFSAIWIFIVFIVRKLNIINFSSSNMILMAAVGGVAIILWILLIFKYYSQKNILTALFLSLSWTISSFFLPWLWNPASYIDSTHRYLTVSAIGISILLATIISLGKKFKNQLYLAAILSVFLILHIISTRTYINKLLTSHSQQKVDKIWSSLIGIPQVGKETLVFYFEKESGNGSVLGDSVLFGYPFHISLLYNLKEGDRLPAVMEEWKDVVSAVKDGQSFKAQGYPLEPIPLNHIYGFHLQGSDNLINITDDIRKKLAQEK